MVLIGLCMAQSNCASSFGFEFLNVLQSKYMINFFANFETKLNYMGFKKKKQMVNHGSK